MEKVRKTLFALILLFFLSSIFYFIRFKPVSRVEAGGVTFVELLDCYDNSKFLIFESEVKIKDVLRYTDCVLDNSYKTGVETLVRNGERIKIDVNGHIIISRMSGHRLFTLGIKMPLNQLSPEELVLLPNIGSELAQKIIKLRNQKGKFKDFEELMEIKGIGKKKLKILKHYTSLE